MTCSFIGTSCDARPAPVAAAETHAVHREASTSAPAIINEPAGQPDKGDGPICHSSKKRHTTASCSRDLTACTSQTLAARTAAPASKPIEAADAAEPSASCAAAEEDPILKSNKRRKTATSSGSDLAFAALLNAAVAAQVSTAAAPSSHAVPPYLPMPPKMPDAAGEGRGSWFTTGPRSAGGLAVASGCSLAAGKLLNGAFNYGEAKHIGGFIMMSH